MPERIERTLSPEAQSIAAAISDLLKEGHVLTSKDLDEIGARYNLRPHFISDSIGRFGRLLPDPDHNRRLTYLIGDTQAIRKRYKGHTLLMNPLLPLEETDWEQVTNKITERLRESGIKSHYTKRRF